MVTSMKYKGAHFLTAAMEPNDLFTPEDLTDEHKMIVTTARQFIEREVHPNRHEIENQNFAQTVKLLRKAGELGLLGHSIPEAYGGLGLDKISKSLVGETVGRTGSYGVAHSNHTCIATLPITYFGTPEQKAKYLPKLATGEYIGAYCLTEPGSGSDALAAQTTAHLNEAGTHYVLNGTKIYITNAEFSDSFIVYAKVDGTQFTAFIVERTFPGLSLGPEENKMGIKGSSTRSVILEDCLVPVENLLGEIGKGHVIALNVLNLGRFNLGSACMGGAKYGLQLAIQFTKERRQFGRAIADFPASKEKIAKMATRIFAAESVQYRTARLLEDALGDLYEATDTKLIANRLMEYATECAICKVYGSETLDQIADEALQLHGGAGFIKEYPVEQMYRDSRINRIFEGTNEINRLLIPTHLFRKAAKEEIPLPAIIQQAIAELQSPTKQELTGPIAKERQAVESIRWIFLLCAGLVYEAFGNQLVEEQETILKLSDIAIQLYATESVVLRSYKAILANGQKKAQLKEKLAISYVEDALLEVEQLARTLVRGIAEGAKRQGIEQMILREVNRYQEGTAGSIARNRSIADSMIEAEQYVN